MLSLAQLRPSLFLLFIGWKTGSSRTHPALMENSIIIFFKPSLTVVTIILSLESNKLKNMISVKSAQALWTIILSFIKICGFLLVFDGEYLLAALLLSGREVKCVTKLKLKVTCNVLKEVLATHHHHHHHHRCQSCTQLINHQMRRIQA